MSRCASSGPHASAGPRASAARRKRRREARGVAPVSPICFLSKTPPPRRSSPTNVLKKPEAPQRGEARFLSDHSPRDTPSDHDRHTRVCRGRPRALPTRVSEERAGASSARAAASDERAGAARRRCRRTEPPTRTTPTPSPARSPRAFVPCGGAASARSRCAPPRARAIGRAARRRRRGREPSSGAPPASAGSAAPATLGSAGDAASEASDARSVGPVSPGASRRGAARSRDRLRYPEGVERAAGAVGDGAVVLSFEPSPDARRVSVPAGGGGGGETKDARRSRGSEARPTDRVVAARGGGGEGVSLPRGTRSSFAEVSATREDAPATPAGGVAGTSRERAVAGSPALPAGGAGRLACSLDRDAVSAPALKSCGARDPHARACAFQSSHWHTREQ